MKKYTDRYHNFERCAHEAPKGTYNLTKNVWAVVETIVSVLTVQLQATKIRTANDDRLEKLMGHIYEYILASNPSEHEFESAESFGEAMLTENKDKVIAHTIKLFEVLKKIKV